MPNLASREGSTGSCLSRFGVRHFHLQNPERLQDVGPLKFLSKSESREHTGGQGGVEREVILP